MPGYRDARGNYHASTDCSRTGYDQLMRELERQNGPVTLDYNTECSLKNLYGPERVERIKRGR